MADQPLINPNWLTHPTDQLVAVAGYKRARAVWESQVVTDGADIGPEYFPGKNVSSDAQILSLIRQSFNTLSHASSTNKMGMKNDTAAVVDSQGRVFGVRKLRVVDASIFPFLPPGLPMGTVCKSKKLSLSSLWKEVRGILTGGSSDMLAEKVADDIRTGRT